MRARDAGRFSWPPIYKRPSLNMDLPMTTPSFEPESFEVAMQSTTDEDRILRICYQRIRDIGFEPDENFISKSLDNIAIARIKFKDGNGIIRGLYLYWENSNHIYAESINFGNF